MDQNQKTGWIVGLEADGEVQWLELLGYGEILWTKDPSEATRMARCEDAEALRVHILGKNGYHGIVTMYPDLSDQVDKKG